ncbi:MAG: DUF1275 family protein [Burkholderiales bacterium]
MAGMVDLLGFYTLGNIFTAHITGNLVVVAAASVRGGQLNLAQAFAIPVAIFALAVLCLVAHASGRRGPALARQLLVIQFLLLTAVLVFSVVAQASFSVIERSAEERSSVQIYNLRGTAQRRIPIGHPLGLAFDACGRLVVWDTDRHATQIYDPNSGRVLQTFPTLETVLTPDGHVWIQQGDRSVEYDADFHLTGRTIPAAVTYGSQLIGDVLYLRAQTSVGRYEIRANRTLAPIAEAINPVEMSPLSTTPALARETPAPSAAPPQYSTLRDIRAHVAQAKSGVTFTELPSGRVFSYLGPYARIDDASAHLMALIERFD